MAASPKGLAHPYVDTAHRAALLYSFATLLIAVFVELSAWSTTINLVAAGVLISFFLGAIGTYIYQGWRQVTENQFRSGAPPGLDAFMLALIVGEIGAFTVLLAGFVDGQIL